MSNPIRDYLYLDIDRVRSIYAQATGGLTESIRQLQEEVSVNSENDESGSESIGQNILLGSGRIATQVMHDYLFTSVETKLSEKIIDVSESTVSDVGPGSLFRISGNVEIDDIERMQNTMENYNDMYGYLLAVGLASDFEMQKWDLQDKMESSSIQKGKNASARQIEKQLNALQPD